MKKILWIALMTMFAQGLLAAETPVAKKMDLLCITEIPTTSFAFHEDGDNIRVEVLHENGVQFMPIFDGILTPSDLQDMAANAKTLMSLGPLLQFYWPKAKCAKQDRFEQSCFGTLPEQKLGGHVVKGWSVYTSQDTTKSFAGTFTSTRASIAMDVDGQTLMIPMRYAPGDCVDDETKLHDRLQLVRAKHPDFGL